MTLSEVGDLLSSPVAELLHYGNYLNRRGIRGYYVQMKCANNWCKISVSHADRHSERITVAELDGIDPTALQPALVIPINSISVALKSSAAEQSRINSYLNDGAIGGIWAEFYLDRSWYMISVSHIDVPAHASPEELTRIADEFLWQQGQPVRGKRRFS